MELHIPAITIKLPLASSLKLVGLCVVASALALCAGRDGAESAATNSLVSPDSAGNVGTLTSLALDHDGFPVISYRDIDSGLVNTLHCENANCTGGTLPEFGNTGTSSSLQIDSNNNWVASIFVHTISDLFVASCLTPDCTGSIVSQVDSTGQVGSDSSLELDANSNPVISYFDFTNGNLKVAHCNDVNCLGIDESLESPDTQGIVGAFTSLELDPSGNPVVSYFDTSNTTIKILHCNDANCAGGDESIQSPEPATSVGSFTSMALDGLGRPVVSYYDSANGRLKVMHCNDVNCAGGGESIQTPDTSGFNGTYNSLALDPAGRPVISYYDSTNADLKVMHCNDVNCAGGDESISRRTRPEASASTRHSRSMPWATPS